VGLHEFAEWTWLEFPMSLIAIIGVVVGLLLGFRTNNAYDRYWEGRKLWSTMTAQVRTLTRSIWIGVKGSDSRDLVEKKSAINLAVAFVTATKHYLREEYDYDSDDLVYLIGHLPRLFTPSSNMPLDEQVDYSAENIPEEVSKSKIPIENGKDSHGLKTAFIQRQKSNRINKMIAYDHPVPTNIPIELSHYLLSYIAYVQDNKMAESFIIGAMSSSLSSMVDCLTSFERILRTPIPLAYSVHLNHSVWLYMLSLPYQLVGTLHWWTILIVGLGSFCLLGILSIGWEIENPFGYDSNDLPLDDFCRVIRREVAVITSHPPPDPKTWLHSKKNRPFGSRCDINAIDLADKPLSEVCEMFQTYSAEDHFHIKINEK